MSTRRIAICYDFDKTLSPDDMQAYTIIPSFGMSASEFWSESNSLATEKRMDKNLAWMKKMLDKASVRDISISKQSFIDSGSKVKLFDGVIDWFNIINGYGNANKIEVEHYIISSGLKEIIEGSAIAPYIKRIYASTFLYSIDNTATWPAQAVNYTNKTQYIFRIAKGAFDENDDRVNASFKEEELYIPYDNMIYIGDSDTDIPCMRLVKSKGGISIGVYDPQKDNRKKVYDLYKDGRINYFAPADYRDNSPLVQLIKKINDYVSAKETLREESEVLKKMTDYYTTYLCGKDIIGMLGLSKKRQNELLNELRNNVKGNIE